MDHDWQLPTVGGLGTAIGILFTHLRYKRAKSAGEVHEAMDTTSKVFVGDVIKRWEEAEAKAASYQSMYVAEKLGRAEADAEVRALKADMMELQAHVRRLTLLVIKLRPEFSEILNRTAFGDLGA